MVMNTTTDKPMITNGDSPKRGTPKMISPAPGGGKTMKVSPKGGKGPSTSWGAD